jgi:5-methylcytosine-specific restriction endonuclease McrA
VANGIGHSGHAWRVARRIVADRNSPCFFCGHHVDMRVKYPHSESFSVHCIVPASRGGSTTDLRNLVSAHLVCNQRQGNRMPWETTIRPPVQWIIEESP